MIEQIEFVSHFFQYTEEYVLEHTPAWIRRKYIQAIKTKHDEHRQQVISQFKGLALFVDAMFMKGKHAADILPPSYDEALKIQQKSIERKSEYVTTQWWNQT